MNKLYALSLFVLLSSCLYIKNKPVSGSNKSKDSAIVTNQTHTDTTVTSTSSGNINTGNVSPDDVVDYSLTLLGTPYKYGSTDPSQGFDCSGFINYVFNHFNINVPRSSVEFTSVNSEVNWQQSKPGDLILFTGTDSTEKTVGHMGIIISNQNNRILFIHSSSGKVNGVTITPLNQYYKSRFVKVIRLFPQNNS